MADTTTQAGTPGAFSTQHAAPQVEQRPVEFSSLHSGNLVGLLTGLLARAESTLSDVELGGLVGQTEEAHELVKSLAEVARGVYYMVGDQVTAHRTQEFQDAPAVAALMHVLYSTANQADALMSVSRDAGEILRQRRNLKSREVSNG